MAPISALALFMIIFLLLFLRTLLLPKKRYPPGPTGMPILGNFREFLAGNWCETFTKWQKLYGDLVFAPSPGQSIYIINSYPLAEEALGNNRASSGRPYSRMFQDLMHWNWLLPVMAPSKEWSQMRYHLGEVIGAHKMPAYRPLINNSAVQLISPLIDFEGGPEVKIRSAVGTILSRLAYGDEIFEEHGQKILDMNSEAVMLGAIAASRFWLVDLFPPLQYTPSWFPGAAFQRIAKRSRMLSDYVRNRPWELVLDRLSRPEGYEGCIATGLIEKYGTEWTVRDAIAVIYVAGIDTTTTTIMIFLLCIMVHPKVQQRVHEELDRVIGLERLPTYEDRASLVYMQAAWKEALRWHPVLPFAIPHATTEDQTIRGYWVPKGSVIFPNTSLMLRDPQIWDSSELYRPERFLVPLRDNQPDPSIGFGYGRRVCPGRFLAEEIGLAVATSILWAFSIEHIEGPASPEEVKWVDSILSPPLPFKLRFCPRTDKIRELLENS